MRVDRRDAGILVGWNLRAAVLFLVPIVNAADERRNQSHSGFGARDRLGEAEEQCQIAVDSFLLQPLGRPDALPGAGDLDQNALAADAFLLIQRDELAGLGDGALSIEAQAGGDFGGNAAGNHFQNFASEQHEKAIDELFGHLLVTAAALEMQVRQPRPPGADKPASGPRGKEARICGRVLRDGAGQSLRCLPYPPRRWCISSEIPIASFGSP